MQQQTLKIINSLPFDLKTQISEIINKHPEVEELFLHSYAAKKKAFKKNDKRAFEQVQHKEEQFIMTEIKKALKKHGQENSDN